MNRLLVEESVRRALAEDAGRGDVTTELLVDGALAARAEIVAKEEGVVAGLPVVAAVFRLLDAALSFTALAEDGERVEVERRVAAVEGPARSILTGERTALNFLQHLSGIASLAARGAQALAGTGCRLLDTRKTLPGLRFLEKYAVRVGGGTNHRFALDDMILIKDNHLALAGGVREALRLVREHGPRHLKVQVEVGNLEELEEALAGGADFILLDNMDEGKLAMAVAMAGGRVPLEASGGVTMDNLARVAATGVDYVSMGQLTHSARAMDFSLRLSPLPGKEPA